MKKMNFRFLTSFIMALAVVFVTSCDEDDPAPVANTSKPVLNENFTATVDVNTVNFTTDLTGNVWVTQKSNGVETQFVDGACSVFIAQKGDYVFTCSMLKDGATVSSDEFTVTIAQSDLSYLNAGIWKALTGGENGNKTWVLDLVEVVSTTIDDAGTSTSTSAFKSAYFHNPLDFYGDDEAGAMTTGTADNWGPWGGTNIYGWGGTPEVGEIKFNGVDKTATFILTDGISANGTKDVAATPRAGTYTGNFDINVFDRADDFCTVTVDGVEMPLWEHMLKFNYKYLGSLSEEMGDLSFASDSLRFPMDKGRVGEQQFLASDLKNVTIIHCSDSALVIRVKRSFEGFNDDGTQKENKCWLLYNYTVKEFDYGVPQPVVHPVKSITATDLVGNWKLADVSCNWIGWAAKNQLNTWADGAAMAATFASWSATNTTEKLAASTKVTLSFTNDGNVTIHDVTYDGTAEVPVDYTTTYTVNNGYVTFGADVTITGFTSMISLTGTHVYAVDVADSADGIWLGQNNGTKEESNAVHLVKVTK